MSKLRFILGDQLSENISALSGLDPQNDIVFLCEVMEESTYVTHHKKKIAFLFSAMRHFAKALSDKGIQVRYVTLDDPKNTQSFTQELLRATQELEIDGIILTEPGEYRVLEMMNAWRDAQPHPVEIRPDTRFLCSIESFRTWAGTQKSLRMEFFYREMRKRHQILMEGDTPMGGQWNYDSENRKPPKQGLEIPPPYSSPHDSITREVLTLVKQKFNHHFGDLEPFYFAVTRKDALICLQRFIEERLYHFGHYQDAMIQGEPWMYHSHISFYLNCGLLEPLECIKAAEEAYHQQNAPLNAVEGFIRQILGWREYVRGIYWLRMPSYRTLNFFEAKHPLPEFFWDAKTPMNCLKQCLTETKQNAYAHHIQRLMVIGNFALIAGLDPDQVNTWYLSVYADAYEWVELPNVTGMILFADGGYLASKPYAASGAYINKMSNYCNSCQYKVSVKNGESACPFNYLYWDFLARNKEKLKNNHRIGMMLKTYERMSEQKKQDIESDSQRFLKSISLTQSA